MKLQFYEEMIVKGAVSRQSSSYCLVFPIIRLIIIYLLLYL